MGPEESKSRAAKNKMQVWVPYPALHTSSGGLVQSHPAGPILLSEELSLKLML